MNLKIGFSYKLNFVITGNLLTYTGKITSIDLDFITFIDKFGKEITYNKNALVNYEEIKKEGGYNEWREIQRNRYKKIL